MNPIASEYYNQKYMLIYLSIIITAIIADSIINRVINGIPYLKKAKLLDSRKPL